MFHQRSYHAPKRRSLFLTLVLLLAFSNTLPILAQEATPPAEPPGDPPIPTLEAPPPPPPTDPPLPPTEPPPPPTDVPPPTATPTGSPTTAPTETLTATPTETPTSAATDSPTAADGATATETGTFVGMPTETGTATETLVGTPIATLTATAFPPEPPLTLVYAETFDNGLLSNWTLTHGWSLVPGVSGQALQTTTADAAASLLNDTLWNVAVHARFQLAGGAATVTLRESMACGYRVELHATGQVALYRGGRLIGAASAGPLIPGSWHALRVSVIDGVLRVAVDGAELLLIGDDVPLPPGKISFRGINLGGQPLGLDDVLVWQPAAVAEPIQTPVGANTTLHLSGNPGASAGQPFNLLSAPAIYSYNFDTPPTPSTLTATVIDHSQDNNPGDNRPGTVYYVGNSFEYFDRSVWQFVNYPLSSKRAVGGFAHSPTYYTNYPIQLEVLFDLQTPLRLTNYSFFVERYQTYLYTEVSFRLRLILDADNVVDNGTLSESVILDCPYGQACTSPGPFQPVDGVRFVRVIYETYTNWVLAETFYVTLDDFEFTGEPVATCSDNTLGVVQQFPRVIQRAQDMHAIADASGLYLHEGPSLYARHIGTVPWGENVNVLHRMTFEQTAYPDEVWYEIQYGAQSGWVAARQEAKYYLEGVDADNDTCAHLSAPTTLTFTYDSEAAARYAMAHAYRNSVQSATPYPDYPDSINRVTSRLTNNNPPIPVNGGELPNPFAAEVPYAYFVYPQQVTGQSGETGSAVFSSESIWMGGLPMTYDLQNPHENCTPDAPLAYFGWRYCAHNQLASHPWRAHDALVPYYSSSDNLVIGNDSGRITSGNDSFLDYENGPLSMEFNRIGGRIQDGAPTLIDLANKHDFYDAYINQNSPTAFTFVGINGVERGDYLWINRSISGIQHGFLVVGWGDITSCPDALGRLWTYEPTSNPDQGQLFESFESDTLRVPYVVDFSGGVSYGQLQRPRPRPFYCAQFFDGNFFDLKDNYAFYEFPRGSVTILSEQLYVPRDWPQENQ